MDTVSDALTRIKNGYLSYKREVVMPYSKLVKAIALVLKEEGYLADVKEVQQDNFQKLSISLKYENRKSVLTDIKRISKPGLRIYKGKTSLPYVLNGLGIAVVSTPKGIMTDKQARKEGVGGEVLAYVW